MGLDILILNSGYWSLADELPADPWHVLIYRQGAEPRNELHLWLPRSDAQRNGLAGCESETTDLIRDIEAAREGCTQEKLKDGDEECVRMFETYVQMGTEAIHTYIGAVKAFDQALQRMPPAQFEPPGSATRCPGRPRAGPGIHPSSRAGTEPGRTPPRAGQIRATRRPGRKVGARPGTAPVTNRATIRGLRRGAEAGPGTRAPWIPATSTRATPIHAADGLRTRPPPLRRAGVGHTPAPMMKTATMRVVPDPLRTPTTTRGRTVRPKRRAREPPSPGTAGAPHPRGAPQASLAERTTGTLMANAEARTTAHPRPYSPVAVAALALAVAVVLLALFGALGARWDIWHFRTGFRMIRWAVYGGVGVALLSVAGLAHTRPAGPRRGFALAFLALVLSLIVVTVPMQIRRSAAGVPPIHDITTDTENPPQFVAIAPLRADAPNPPHYAGPEVASQQRQAYPEIRPLVLDLPSDRAFSRALDAARAMGWEIVDVAPNEGRIEATDRTFWFGFRDDVTIRVTATGGRSIIDARSKSRVGRGDMGTNARRVREYLGRVQGR